jgi:hypothetical protein
LVKSTDCDSYEFFCYGASVQLSDDLINSR